MIKYKKEILQIFDETLIYVQSSVDFAYSRWVSIEDALTELLSLYQRIQKDDFSAVIELKNIFYPTASMQELSIDNNWGNEYIDLASRLDTLL